MVLRACYRSEGSIPWKRYKRKLYTFDRNKDSREYSENFTRKTSRTHTNIDLLHRLLSSSDPVILKKKTILTKEVLILLNDSDIYFSDSEKE